MEALSLPHYHYAEILIFAAPATGRCLASVTVNFAHKVACRVFSLILMRCRWMIFTRYFWFNAFWYDGYHISRSLSLYLFCVLWMILKLLSPTTRKMSFFITKFIFVLFWIHIHAMTIAAIALIMLHAGAFGRYAVSRHILLYLIRPFDDFAMHHLMTGPRGIDCVPIYISRQLSSLPKVTSRLLLSMPCFHHAPHYSFASAIDITRIDDSIRVIEFLVERRYLRHARIHSIRYAATHGDVWYQLFADCFIHANIWLIFRSFSRTALFMVLYFSRCRFFFDYASGIIYARDFAATRFSTLLLPLVYRHILIFYIFLLLLRWLQSSRQALLLIHDILIHWEGDGTFLVTFALNTFIYI